ncbi:pantoate--beta-alanine ligase [Vulcanibacillus modesticaldus]|uniref:Pantothenate synthetase n=1 Tax=Vulcanibacillus modesticaldus TaxID=337097 RepID=A0A1D2YW20_9BACI|nr:pantoate--beta-alanine ligase [Vulcanibacillus modesticaldus]OEF99873.1 pantoate--beta-alanine ligase [Vulcanibacillus modesticaldus]
MKVFKKIKEIKSYLGEQIKQGMTIGFVPTMGYLHEGHLSLIRYAAKDNDIVVVSVFVNPTQFGPGEDLEKYPRDLDRDIRLAQQAGATVLFTPEVEEMYPNGYKTYVEVEQITGTLCGASRPGHFRGVTTVVSKLFNIINPNRAYFGQKDAQQSIVIKRMVKDLNMDIEIIVCPIVRESDGLAMSSRNVYLNKDEREQAVVLSQSLFMAKEMIQNGEKDALKIKKAIIKMIKEKPLADIDYVSIVDIETLTDVSEINNKVLIALAVRFGKTRLIDNIMAEGK